MSYSVGQAFSLALLVILPNVWYERTVMEGEHPVLE